MYSSCVSDVDIAGCRAGERFMWVRVQVLFLNLLLSLSHSQTVVKKNYNWLLSTILRIYEGYKQIKE